MHLFVAKFLSSSSVKFLWVASSERLQQGLGRPLMIRSRRSHVVCIIAALKKKKKTPESLRENTCVGFSNVAGVYLITLLKRDSTTDIL